MTADDRKVASGGANSFRRPSVKFTARTTRLGTVKQYFCEMMVVYEGEEPRPCGKLARFKYPVGSEFYEYLWLCCDCYDLAEAGEIV